MRLTMFIGFFLFSICSVSLFAESRAIIEKWNSLSARMSVKEAKPILEKLCNSKRYDYLYQYEDCDANFLGEKVSSIKVQIEGWLFWKKIKYFTLEFDDLDRFSAVDAKLATMFRDADSDWKCSDSSSFCRRFVGVKGIERGKRYLELEKKMFEFKTTNRTVKSYSITFCEDLCF